MSNAQKNPTNTNVNQNDLTNVNANATEKTKAKAKKDFTFESLSNIKGGGALLYKSEIYSDCTCDKDKKRLRIKIRNTRDKFFGAFLQNEKNAEKMQAIKKDWLQFSTNTYIDVKNIIDANGANDNVTLAKRFIDAMDKVK